MTQKQLQGDWEKKLNNGTSCYNFIFHSWKSFTQKKKKKKTFKKNHCARQQILTGCSYFTPRIKTTAAKAKRREQGDINPPIKLSTLINCGRGTFFFFFLTVLRPLTRWQFDPSPSTMTQTLPRTSGVLCVNSKKRPAQQQIVLVLHHNAWV